LNLTTVSEEDSALGNRTLSDDTEDALGRRLIIASRMEKGYHLMDLHISGLKPPVDEHADVVGLDHLLTSFDLECSRKEIG
jgi:hypothetical protein